MATVAITRGLIGISADAYHADPAEVPSLSASIAAILCTQSPAHARAAHPRLNPDFERVEKPHFDLGTVVHQLLLEGHTDSLVAVDAKDWRTNAAQEERDAAYAAGKTPILAKELPRITAMVDAVNDQLAKHEADPPLFTDGKAEQTIIWEEEGGVVCRARLDWLRDDLGAVDDLKTVGRAGGADPYRFSRSLFGIGYDIKAAFYLRGIKAVTGAEPEFRFVAIETEPPYALSVIGIAPSTRMLGEKKVRRALDLWRTCLDKNDWPAYTRRVAYAELPGWEEERWLERELEEEAA